MRVRIKSCAVSNWWYTDLVGQEFDLNPLHYHKYSIKDRDVSGYVIANTKHNRKFRRGYSANIEEMILSEWFIAEIDCEPVSNRDAVGTLYK